MMLTAAKFFEKSEGNSANPGCCKAWQIL